jgi:hypothetical protein
MTHRQISQKGGRSKSPAKQAAGRINMAKALAARLAKRKSVNAMDRTEEKRT